MSKNKKMVTFFLRQEPAMEPRLASNFQSSRLGLSSVEIIGVQYHAKFC